MIMKDEASNINIVQFASVCLPNVYAHFLPKGNNNEVGKADNWKPSNSASKHKWKEGKDK